VIGLKKSGELLYYYKFYENFSTWFNEGQSVFEQLITMWVEDVFNTEVLTTAMMPIWAAPTSGGFFQEMN
jgi:hypothetical protein